MAAYEDARFGSLRELTLKKCVEVWSWSPPEASDELYRAAGALSFMHVRALASC